MLAKGRGQTAEILGNTWAEYSGPQSLQEGGDQRVQRLYPICDVKGIGGVEERRGNRLDILTP
ncbi:hypothetical protein PM082_012839 [Marasmius tenuissimus]|nr:hypothetical protein PM082_012839 [Marasmius tenuissimus]